MHLFSLSNPGCLAVVAGTILATDAIPVSGFKMNVAVESFRVCVCACVCAHRLAHVLLVNAPPPFSTAAVTRHWLAMHHALQTTV